MTVQDVVNDLITNGAYTAYDGAPRGAREDKLQIIPIYYTIEVSDDILREQSFDLIQNVDSESEDHDKIYYRNSKPSILKPTEESDPPRDFHFTLQEIVTHIETKYGIIDEDNIEDDVTMRRSGSYDNIHAHVIDDKGMVGEVQYLAYDDKGTPTIKEVSK